jgi:deoxycytidylate deaminase
LKLLAGALALALSQAKKSPMNHKHGAVIWKGKKILAAGYNYHMPAPGVISRKFSIHSERDCLNGLRAHQIHGSSMLAIRITSAGSLSHGAPCKGCKKLLKRKGIKKVFWFDKDKNLNCTRLN